MAIWLTLAATTPAAALAGQTGIARTRSLKEAQNELNVVAERIRVLKSERATGRFVGPELDKLLIRSQELAGEIERLQREQHQTRPIPAPGPDARELRERADLLRDDADRMSRDLQTLDKEIASAKRQQKLESRLGELGDEGGLFDEAGTGALSRSRDPRADSLRRTATTLSSPAASPSTRAESGKSADSTSAAPSPVEPQAGGSSGEPLLPTVSPTPEPRLPPVRERTGTLPPGASARGSIAAQPGDDSKTLLRKKAQLEEALKATRAKAEALDMDAKALDQIR